MHSLTVRLDPGTTFEVVRERAAVVADLSLWRERAVSALVEAARPLHGATRGSRAVYVEHADGPADLVLVASRSELSATRLRGLARALADGGPIDAAEPAPEPVIAEAGTPDWGLGDPSAHGDSGEVPIPLEVARPTDALLLAAAVITFARYSGSDRASVAVWHAARTGPPAVHHVDCTSSETVGEHLARYQSHQSPAGVASSAQFGVVLDVDRPGERYLPFLALPLPVVVHWRRAADGSVSGTLGYRALDIAAEIARGFAEHLAHVARQLAADPALALGEIELMPPRRARDLARAQAASAAEGPDATIHGLVAEVAARQPDAVALVDETRALTYAELEQSACRLAQGLSALGVERGSIVAVALDRTADLVVALLAVLKAGCGYLPVDIRYPADRLKYTVEHAGARVVIGQGESFPQVDGVRLVAPEELAELADRGGERPLPATEGPDLAYVIYTSGSTGRPKGVAVPHRNVAALVSATRHDFALGPQDVWTFFHSVAFDFSVWEIWGCLLTGGRLVVVPYWVSRDTELFYELVDRRRVTVLNQTPSAFAQFAEVDGGARADLALRLVVFGGEALDVGVLGPWFARRSPSSCRMVNMFGITETTVHVTAQTLTPADVAAGSRSVGRALPGWSVSVRDQRGRVLPPGVAGEIHVGGAGVARGYLHQPELTEERFVVDAHGGGRLYRSGDLGRLRPDGRLDHLGRIDDQVKLRGHRIELGEIRGVLLGHLSVAAAAVVLRYATPGDRDTARIDAYYVVRGDVPGIDQELRGHAAAMLPEYMLPTTLTRLDAIPLTANGKADQSALPEPAAVAPPGPTEREPDADTTESRVLALWSRLLNTPVAPHDNFFELGGNSLLVVRMLRELPEHGLPRVAMRDFYRNSVAGRFIELVRTSD
jgi:amino acid adenylation domain-containing protein